MKYTLVINEMKITSHIKALPNRRPIIYGMIESTEELEFNFESDFEYNINEKVDLSEIDERIGEIYITNIIKTTDRYRIETYKSIILHDENNKFVQDEYRQLLEEYCQRSLWERIRHTRNKLYKSYMGMLILGSIAFAIRSFAVQETIGTLGWLVACFTSVNAMLMKLDIEHMEDGIID